MMKLAVKTGIGALIALAMMPARAGAVVTDIHIVGQPQECTFKLEHGGKTDTITTDNTGHAKIELTTNETVTITTQNTDYAPIPYKWTVPSTGTYEIPTVPSAPLVQNPVGFGEFGFAPRYDGDYLRNMKLTKDVETFGGHTTSGNLKEGPKPNFNMNEGSVDFPIGMPPMRLCDRTYLFFSPVFTAGGASFNLNFTDRKNGDSINYNGSGAVIGGGFNSTIMSSTTPWFTGVDMLYRTNFNNSVSPSPDFSSGSFSQSEKLSFYQWNASAKVGYSFNTGFDYARSIAPWAGVAFDSTNLSLTGWQMFSGQKSSFETQVASNDVRGIVGADTHVWGPIFERTQVSFNDRDVSVGAKLVYQFNPCRWFH
jgi:hypothetical protein